MESTFTMKLTYVQHGRWAISENLVGDIHLQQSILDKRTLMYMNIHLIQKEYSFICMIYHTKQVSIYRIGQSYWQHKPLPLTKLYNWHHHPQMNFNQPCPHILYNTKDIIQILLHTSQISVDLTTQQALEACKDAGLTKSLGVSNFNRRQLELILNKPGLKHRPVSNQV